MGRRIIFKDNLYETDRKTIYVGTYNNDINVIL
jgi:hypothetical protein